jgi:hypothetical protein
MAHPLLASNLHYQPASEQQAWFLLNLEMTARHVVLILLNPEVTPSIFPPSGGFWPPPAFPLIIFPD